MAVTKKSTPQAGPAPIRSGTLEVQEVVSAGWWRLRLRGEVDMVSATVLLDVFSGARSRDGVTGIEVDLGEVTFIDSTGVRALISMDHHCREDGTRWRITHTPRHARRLFEVTGILDRLPLQAEDGHLPRR
jgi:anti-anti-sigma factor